MDIINFHTGIRMERSPNSTVVANTIQCLCGITNGAGCSENQYVGNNLTGVDKRYGVGLQCWGYDILVAKNNFANFSKNVDLSAAYDTKVEGNFWSDYDGKDSNGDGVGDTPYVIWGVDWKDDRGEIVDVVDGQDNYPLMSPYGSDNHTVIPPLEPQSEPFPTVPIVAVSVAAVVVGAGLLLLYRKRRREAAQV